MQSDTVQFVWEQATKASNQWWALMSRNNYAQAHIYYRTGELAVFFDGEQSAARLDARQRLNVSARI